MSTFEWITIGGMFLGLVVTIAGAGFTYAINNARSFGKIRSRLTAQETAFDSHEKDSAWINPAMNEMTGRLNDARERLSKVEAKQNGVK